MNTISWKKKVALFLVSQNVSLFGSSIVGFAIMWHITLETSSGMWMMLATICSMLPQVFISLFAGVLADRHNRRTLIMIADGFIALSTLGLAIVFSLGAGSLWLLLAVSVVRSIGAGIQTPAVNALYPQLVPMEQLTRVQGISQTLSSVLLLVSPAVGGILLGTVGLVGAFYVDVVTAAAAILIMTRIKVDKVERADAQTSFISEIKEGFRYVAGNKTLKRVLICFAFAWFLVTPPAILSPLLVERSYGSEVWMLTVNEMLWTAGSFIGGVIVSVKGKFKNKHRVVSLSLVGMGAAFALLGVGGPFALYLTFMGLGGVCLPFLSTVQTVLIQESTVPDKMGRVFSIVQIITTSAVPVAILLFGPLADVVSVESIMLVSGILLAIIGLLFGGREAYGPRLTKE